MTTINFTQTCKKQGITTFARTRGGWMKLVEGYNNQEYGGYRFIGSKFIKVGNYDTEIPNGLYLDCSKHYNKEDNKVIEIMNLFDIKDGNITLLNTIPKSTKKWANKFEKDVNNYFTNDTITTEQIKTTLYNTTCNKEKIYEVAREILTEEIGKVWLNEAHFRAYMQEACIYNVNYLLSKQNVQEKATTFLNSFEDEKYFNYNINKKHQSTILYSLITTYVTLKQYADFKVEFEQIPENYYTNIKHIKELREFNRNLIQTKGALHDEGYYVTFSGMYANTKTVYIIIPNVLENILKIQKMELHL